MPDSPTDFCPETPTRIGDKWTLDSQAIASIVGQRPIKGTGEVQFLELCDCGGERCANLYVKFRANWKEFNPEGESETELEVAGFCRRSLATKLNVALELDGRCSLSQKNPKDPRGINMIVTGRVTIRGKEKGLRGNRPID